MTDMQIPIVVPFEIVNYKEVTLIEWVRQSGEPVSKNETIAIIETSKMNVDLSAPADGFLKHLHKIGTDIPVGEIIGYVIQLAPEGMGSAFILAHELGHIGNYDMRYMTLVAVLVGMIAIISEIFLRSLWFKSGLHCRIWIIQRYCQNNRHGYN